MFVAAQAELKFKVGVEVEKQLVSDVIAADLDAAAKWMIVPQLCVVCEVT